MKGTVKGTYRLKRIHSTHRHHRESLKGRVSTDDHPLNKFSDLQIDNIVSIIVRFKQRRNEDPSNKLRRIASGTSVTHGSATVPVHPNTRYMLMEDLYATPVILNGLLG